ncbi:N-acetylmuramoyl-L-alanine amidase [Bifidobacterium pseudolongum subsp. globosum]|uniref:N-acetylmuramoyl-L-alanine amidase n=1 Tax=Bifidobacterium pseudolongum subsp. globosum TaxID=1690 RepID=A0A4Q5AIG8_9BIFI|nr:N-acetylmuramoyl-L-alanine amidase [Bifidobacterium pseudolongum]RYQ21405.1 N-acetylmuramoyl-L-alanine amidase [Bifidobacterium pseudolongum subsp. globosum]RYQ29971.1 N-acetylmuramoyl-L-alanine amidase [Bifidobacterium pseudolongum subsp. globosum]
MVVIREDLVNNGHGALAPSFLAVHSTANPGATAKNHRDLWSRGYDYAVHYTSDWHEAYHTVPDNRLCWQVGNGNPTCVGIEICEATNKADFDRGIQIAADVCAQILKKHGWGIDRMHPHQWFSNVYGGSDHTDPYPYFARWGYSWDKFVSLVNNKLNKPTANTVANIKKENPNMHVIFRKKGTHELYVADMAAGTYRHIPNPNALKTMKYVFEKTGEKCRTWAQCVGKKEEFGDVAPADMPAFGVLVKDAK